MKAHRVHKSKQYRPQPALLESPTLNLTLPAVRGCTGYIIHGIAPIPVHVGIGERVRVEPTEDGYNLWEIDHEP